MTTLLALHDIGDAAGCRRWDALVDAWPGPVVAPDLPGHGDAPPPEDGKWVSSDVALYALRAVAGAADDGPAVVVGAGWGAFGAELFAAGGRAAGIVLVDGLGGPWRSHADAAAETRGWLRACLADGRLDDADDGRPDASVVHGFPPIWQRDFVEPLRSAVAVPVLALETPRSPTPADEREPRLASFGGRTMCRLVSGDGVALAAAVVAWARSEKLLPG